MNINSNGHSDDSNQTSAIAAAAAATTTTTTSLSDIAMDQATTSNSLAKAVDVIQKTPAQTPAPGLRRRQLPTKKRKLPSSLRGSANHGNNSRSSSDVDDEIDHHHQHQQKCPKTTTSVKEEDAATTEVMAAITVEANLSNTKPKGIQAQLNDVLMGKTSSPSSTFHHIGNRRFRVLVEANLQNYFCESITTDLDRILASEDHRQHQPPATEMQCRVVDSIVECVQGNIPAGRFLVPFSDSDDDDDDDNDTATNNDEEERPATVSLSPLDRLNCLNRLNWRLASVEEVANKVHSTFLAAGRFHLKQNQLELQLLAANAASLQRHRVEQISEDAVGVVPTAATAEVGMDGAANAVQVTATVVEKDAVEPPPQAGLGEAYHAPTTTTAPKREEVPSCGYSDAIANALSKYHAKNKRAAAALEEMSSSTTTTTTTASAEESAPSSFSFGASSWKGREDNNNNNERTMKSPAPPAEVSVDNSSNSSGGEVEYLAAEESSSPRINTNATASLPTGLPSRGRKSIFKERMEKMSAGKNDIIEHQQQQQQQQHGEERTSLQGGEYTFGQQTGLLHSLFPGVHPNYRPLRNNNVATGRATSSSLEGMKGATAAAEMIMSSSLAPVPTSIDQLHPVPSSGAVSTTPTLMSRANSEISISPPLHLASPPAVAMTAGLQRNQNEVKKGYQDASRAPVDTVATSSMPTTAMENSHLSSSLQCPARIKVFLALPIDRFFVEDKRPDDRATTSSSCGLPAGQSTACVPPAAASYVVPSNYDVLCGPAQSFFHHVGNRRFRITIEMNVRRYEDAYMASSAQRRSSTLSDGSTSTSDNDTTMGGGGGGGEYEGSIQNLINEMLISLSKCDPPGRFLGMDMTNGRWRVLNPVFAQLKTEQTFFECLRVKQHRVARLQQEEEARRLEEDCKQRRSLVCDEETPLEELEEGRGMQQIDTAFGSGKRRATVETTTTTPAASATGGGRRPSRRVSQAALPDETIICPASGFRTLLAEEDLSVLQEQAKSLLRRRPEAVVRRFPPESLEASLVAASNCRVSSLLASSFSGQQQHEGNSMSNTAAGPFMPSNSSCSQSLLSNPSTATSVTVPPAAAATSTQQHYGQQVSSPPSNDDNDGKCPQVKDLLDVVGGMMMMSRRGSATLVPLDNT